MQAIITKFIPATNYRPSRYKATCQRGSITVSAACELNNEENHEMARNLLCHEFASQDTIKYGGTLMANPWMRKMVCGQLPDGSYAHVFIGETK